jgi:hypothetical protein
MITLRDFFIFSPIWALAKEAYIKRTISGTPTWVPIKQAYIKKNNAWNQIYSQNAVGSFNTQHPYWQYTLDSEFRVNDSTTADALSTSLFNTFWSTANTGTYVINGGTARVNLNNVTRTVIPGTAEVPGFYNFTTESRSIFCNFTPNSAQAVTFSSPGVLPINRSGVDGATNIKWSIRAFGFTRSGTQISSLASDNGTVQTFNMSQTAQNFSGNGNGITTTIDRTYASSYTPPVPATPTQYNYYGISRMLSNYELRVSTGQTYNISTSVTTGNVGTNTRWGIVVYTSPNAGQAQPFGTGSQTFQSPTYGNNTAQSFNMAVPNGHLYMRVGVFVEYDLTSTTDTAPTLPRWARFDYIRVNYVPLG